jgi:hypothetical protein
LTRATHDEAWIEQWDDAGHWGKPVFKRFELSPDSSVMAEVLEWCEKNGRPNQA